MNDLAAQVERARQCWNSGDLEGYLSLYDDAARLHGYSPEPMGKSAVRAFYEAVYASLGEAGRPNPTLVFHETMTSGDRYCCRFTMSAEFIAGRSSACPRPAVHTHSAELR
jgi:SnoaL-like domain